MIAVTGATGQLGSLIIEHLLEAGIPSSQLIAVARTPDKAADLARKGIKVRQGDYSDLPSLITACDGVKTLMFISNTDFDVREQEHDNVVDAAKRVGIPHIVYTSIVDMGESNPLMEGHHRTENYIKDNGFTWTFLRNNFYMEPSIGAVEKAINMGTFRTPRPGDVGAALVLREDIARTAAVVLTTDGHEDKTYNLTGPTQVTPLVVAGVASKVSGKEVNYRQISWEELAADYDALGLPPEAAGMAIWVEQIYASGALSAVSNDIARITGEKARSFAEFVESRLG